jgi:hypothetical protein
MKIPLILLFKYLVNLCILQEQWENVGTKCRGLFLVEKALLCDILNGDGVYFLAITNVCMGTII